MKKPSLTENGLPSIRASWRSLLGWGLLTMVLMSVTLSLAHWQWRRSVEKQTQHEAAAREHAKPVSGGRIADPVPLYRRFALKGRWRHDKTLFLDNQIWQGRAGYHVLTPFLPDGGSRWMIVNRGWMPKRFDAAPAWRAQERASNDLIVEARPWPNDRPLLTRNTVIQGLNRLELKTMLHADPSPVLWLELGDEKDGLIRVWPAPSDDDINKHRSYMGQWILFTVMIFGAYCFYVWKRWAQ